MKNSLVISLDRYYKDWSRLSFKQREKINFDKPYSFDWVLLKKQLNDLAKGRPILAPCYSYKIHARLRKRIKINPKKWIIVEGLLLLYKKSIRDLFDLKIYIDSGIRTSIERRLRRDLKHRGESIKSVLKRYFQDVLPMQKKFVELQKGYADIVVDGNKRFSHKLLKRLVKKCKILKK